MQDIYKQAINLQFKYRDYVDDKSHPMAQQLNRQIQRLTDDIESQKNTRSLEDLVKQIIRLLEQTDGSGVMDDRHVDDLKDRCEDIRNDLRKLQ
jgi:hypothetical protein